MKVWRSRPLPTSPPPLPDWAERLNISPFLLDILWKRGLDSPEEIDVFLSPGLRHLAPPEDWPGIEHSAQTLAEGLLAGKKFAVWGDYDVDGVTSVALVQDVLATHGIEAVTHLPDRRGEGYGLNNASLELLAAQGVRLLLTVDCGISDVQAVDRARELGMCVVISDHHLPPPELPKAHAICNPRLAACPCPHLAGVGVTFFLVNALNALLAPHTGARHDMRETLDLVALGTLADVVRLSGQNRILVKNGLLKIAQASRPGMAALKEVCGFHPAASLSGSQVVFSLAPRINAAGRLGNARLAFDLLRGADYDKALELARALDDMNTRRRTEEERMYLEASVQAQEHKAAMGLVLYKPDWHPGIIGIVASRIVEDMYRPTLVLCNDQSSLKGSGRSIYEFDLYGALSSLEDLFLAFGGHKLAAGLRLKCGKLEELRARFDAAARESLGDTPPAACLTLDGELGFDKAADFTLLKELELLQPFGSGNAEPVFASPPLTIHRRRVFGPGKNHVVLEVEDVSCGITLHAKAWRQAGALPDNVCGRRIRLAYTPRMDAWNGAPSVDVRIKDWKFEETP
jgi:single-stranded-DNA-specific exonuclease